MRNCSLIVCVCVYVFTYIRARTRRNRRPLFFSSSARRIAFIKGDGCRVIIIIIGRRETKTFRLRDLRVDGLYARARRMRVESVYSVFRTTTAANNSGARIKNIRLRDSVIGTVKDL